MAPTKDPDFGGYATKNDIVCTDGRTIKAGAFAHHDGATVPLVWQHQHDSVKNMLGHAILQHRDDGVYALGFFNDTEAGREARELVKHGDITKLSIYANKLKQNNLKHVLHGNIREVSLVLAGANEGATIDSVFMKHSDSGNWEEIEDEVIIHTGLDITLDVEHAEKSGEDMATPAPAASGEKTVKDIYEAMTDEEKNVVAFMIGEAIKAESGDDDDDDDLEQSGLEDGEALAQSALGFGEFLSDTLHDSITHSMKEGFDHIMSRNAFEQNGPAGADSRQTLSHDQLTEILNTAKKDGSLKDAVLAHAGTFGIDNIEVLFPDAKALSNSPEVIGRRTEWVAEVLNGTKHSPFARIKSTAVDLTADEARAKGYVKGNLKKDEIIKLLKRVTTPTTIYKKQKLDRDDIVDIVDLDVVAWLKAEMRLMLDEELARAVLIGDGRDTESEDKIDEDHIRPIAYDADMYAHSVVINGDTTPDKTVEAIVRARTYYKGTGTPTFYTTDGFLTDLILQKDKMGRRLYETEAALAAALRVSRIVTVEVMDSTPDIVGIMVNLADYTLGADRGGAVSMFDDFDIDYNQQKYLIETRVSGALTKPKSAVVVKRVVGTIVVPAAPSFNGTTNTITFPATAGVVYQIDGSTVSGAVTIEETTDVEARPASGYSFPRNTNTDWTYVHTGA